MSLSQQQLLFEAIARAKGDARLEVKQRHIATCPIVGPTYWADVATALGITVSRAAE